MDKEKYIEETHKNLEKYTEKTERLAPTPTPEAWPAQKEALEEFIEDQDELHTVYTEENKSPSP